MVERLIVDGFLGMKEVDLDLGRINILIGSQATGKSVCAKLLYHFKEFLERLAMSAMRGKGKKEFDNSYVESFETRFPRSSWGSRPFSVRYEFHGFYVEIVRSGTRDARLALDYPQDVAGLRTKFKQMAQQVDRRWKKGERSTVRGAPFSDMLPDEQLFKRLLVHMGSLAFAHQALIPASRTFFAQLRSRIFSFLARDMAVDPFLVEFGAFYETFLERGGIFPAKGLPGGEIGSGMRKLVNGILCGEYANGKDGPTVVHADGRRTNLSHCSSGQQATLPLVAALCDYPFRNAPGSRTDTFTLFIEEPEIHLFPTAQRHVVELMATVFNRGGFPLQLFITTHSPYILTAFNNLLHAGALQKNLPKSKLKKLRKIVPEEQALDPQVIRAYALEGGKCQDLRCQETGLISADVIDDVSNDLSVQFGKLLDLE